MTRFFAVAFLVCMAGPALAIPTPLDGTVSAPAMAVTSRSTALNDWWSAGQAREAGYFQASTVRANGARGLLCQTKVQPFDKVELAQNCH